MSKPIIRYLRFHCPTPTSMTQANRDGALAVAAINEGAGLAQMLLVAMRRWGRNDGASGRDALGVLVHAAHQRLVAGFGISLTDNCSGSGTTVKRSTGSMAWLRRGWLMSNRGATRRGGPGGRSCHLNLAGPVGAAMLNKVEAMVGAVRAGREE
jgi:hypothetical protein